MSTRSTNPRLVSIVNMLLTERPERLAQTGLWAAVLALGLFLSLKNYQSFQVGFYQDDASYAILTESLVQGPAYGFINEPGDPGVTRYPFGFPLALAPVALLQPGSPDALKIISLLATVLNSALIFWGWHLLSPRLSRWWGLAAAALYTLAPLVVGHTRGVMSEPIFTSWALIGLMLAERGRVRRGMVWIVMLSGVLMMAVATRTIGAGLVFAVFGYLLLRCGRAAWRDLGMVALGILLWVGVVLVATPVHLRDLLPTGYLYQLTTPNTWAPEAKIEESAVPRLIGAVSEYSSVHFRQLVLPIGGGASEQELFGPMAFLSALLGLVFSGVILLGFWRWFRVEGITAGLLWVGFYLSILLFWPWRGTRFLYPVFPQFLLAFLLGSSWIAAKVGTAFHPGIKIRTLLLPAAATVVSLILGIAYIYKSNQYMGSEPYVGNLSERTAWFRSGGSAPGVVMTEQPQVDFIYGGNKTIEYGGLESADDLAEYLLSNRVDYVLVAPDLRWAARDTSEPSLSVTAQRVLELIERLPQGVSVRLVYNSEPSVLSIYQVLRE